MRGPFIMQKTYHLGDAQDMVLLCKNENHI